MTMRWGLLVTVLAACVGAASAAAQGGGKPIIGGNPTPGTAQPDPPDVARRVTVTGCVALAKESKTAAPVDGNTVMDSRWVLTSVEQPPRVQYKLAAIESQLSPFAGAKVEMSGEPRDGLLLVEFVRKLADRCR